MRRLLLALLLLAPFTATNAADATNVILVTVDGLRWQEVFRGPDAKLLQDERFTPKDYARFTPHQEIGAERARAALMPFLWSTLASNGALLGDRDHGSRMRVSNPWWFSYPGYNEILTGRVDPKIDSNDKRWNPNVTVLEWLNARPDFHGRIQAFGSWDVFPYIINSQRSGIPVNVGGTPIVGKPTEREQWLQQLQAQMPLAFPAVRHDAFTHQHALEALRSDKPRVVYIAYGEPDDFAHLGKYGEYLDATHRFDMFLKELWERVQSDRAYAGRTTLLVTTDHGRGEVPIETWQHHSSRDAVRKSPGYLSEYEAGIVGSDHVWLAALGAGIAGRGLIQTGEEQTHAQVAATLLSVLGIDAAEFDRNAGAPLRTLIETQRR